MSVSRHHGRAAAGVLLLVIAAAGRLAGQGVITAALAGRVVDRGGAPLSDARIEVRHEGTGAEFTASSDAEGRFYIPNLRPGGPYTLTVSRLGFGTAIRESIHLRIGQTLDVDVSLADEAVPLPELAVEIETDPEFDPSRMGAATFVDELTLERLPTIRRDFVEFARLSPLVKVDDEGISFAGANFRFNNIQVDGALNQDVFGLSPSGVAGGQARGRVIPLGAIEELQVLVAPYDVRQSGFTGGVLNAVTRTGTNRWAGSAFGFLRDESLVGDLVIDDVSRKPEELDDLYVGFTLGGPLVRDRFHLFAAGELERRRQPPDGFHVGVDGPFRTKLSPDSVARLESILSGYGVEAGAAGPVTLENDIANLFARVDLRIDDRNAAMLRYNLAEAADDPAPNRLPGDAYELSSHGTGIESVNHSVVGQWLSAWGATLSNELLVNVQFLRDEEVPLSTYPRIEVDIASAEGENILQRRIRAGAEFFAQRSELDQDILQISNAVTWSRGSHRIVFGGAFERFGIRRLYEPGSLGSYQFGSLDSLEANLPRRYDLRLPLGEGDPTVRFTVNEWAAFLQDEWRASDALNIRLGVRVDLPLVTGSPASNPDVAEDFGVDSSAMPSGNPLFSPRLGFNLRLGGAGGTQVRGGLGLFAGRPPFAWLANAFQSTGLETAFLSCENELVDETIVQIAPPFDPARPPPTACLDGTRPLAPVVTVFDPDFRFPQDFKISLALDQRLPGGLVGTLEGIFTRAVHQIFLEELNLGDPVPDDLILHENGYTRGFGFERREVFGDPTPEGFAPRRRSDRFAQVIRVTNRSENFAYGLSARLRRRFGDRFAIDAGYSFNRSADVQSLISLDPIANFGFTAVEGDPNDPKRQPSRFDRPHKVVAQAAVRVLERLGGTEISLVYVGQSGAPYSYVYLGDVNGDGFPGDGAALDLTNDLLYIPGRLSEFPTGGVSGLLFESLVAREPCLERHRGTVLSRNACRAPWSNELDLRITQQIRAGDARFHLYLDMLNVLNWIDDGWGRVERANPLVQGIRVPGRSLNPLAGPQDEQPLIGLYSGPVATTPGGGIRAQRPTVPTTPASQWQMQLGLRVSF